MMPTVAIFTPGKGSPFFQLMVRKYRKIGFPYVWFIRHRLLLAEEIDELNLPYDRRECLTNVLDDLTEWFLYDTGGLYRSFAWAAGIFAVTSWLIPIWLVAAMPNDRIGLIGLTMVISLVYLIILFILCFKLVADTKEHQTWRNHLDQRIQDRYQDRGALVRDLELLAGLDPDITSNIHRYHQAIAREHHTA